MQVWKVKVEIRPWEEGGYLAEAPALQGCWVVAETVEAALQDIYEGIEMSITSRLKHGEPLPEEVVRVVVPKHGMVQLDMAVAVP